MQFSLLDVTDQRGYDICLIRNNLRDWQGLKLRRGLIYGRVYNFEFFYFLVNLFLSEYNLYNK